MNSLPCEPLVAQRFCLLPSIEHTHRHPWMPFENGIFNDQYVIDWEEAGSLEIITLQFGVIWEQEIDFRVSARSPCSCCYARIDFPRAQQIVLTHAVRNLQVEPLRRSPVTDAFGLLCHPGVRKHR